MSESEYTRVFPWEDPLASEFGRRLADVATYLHTILGDFAEPLRHIATQALTQTGKLFASPTATANPLAKTDQSLWSFSVLLTYVIAAGQDPLQIADASWNAIIPIAAAGEILGLAFDLSDDIQDGDGTFIGEHDVALVEPLTVFFFALLHRCVDDARITPKWRPFLHGLLTSAIVTTAEAQFLDGWFEHQTAISPEDALRVTRQKAGPLISCLYQMGAYMGFLRTQPILQSQRWSREFSALGTILGTWHQIDNDDRDAEPTTVKSDRIRGKKTLPLVMEAVIVQETHDAALGRQIGRDIALIAMDISRHDALTQIQHIAAVTGCSVNWLQWLVMSVM